MKIKKGPVLGVATVFYVVNFGIQTCLLKQDQKLLPEAEAVLRIAENNSDDVWEEHWFLDDASPTYNQELTEWRGRRNDAARYESMARRIFYDVEMNIENHQRRRLVIL